MSESIALRSAEAASTLVKHGGARSHSLMLTPERREERLVRQLHRPFSMRQGSLAAVVTTAEGLGPVGRRFPFAEGEVAEGMPLQPVGLASQQSGKQRGALPGRTR